MKGLILCAGKGLGLRPLTLNRPKPAIKLANTPIVCHCIQKLLEANISEIGIVISPQGDEIEELVKDNFPDLHPVFITQHQPTGLAAAVAASEKFICRDNFILLLGDNFFVESLDSLIERHKSECTDAVIMVTYVKNPEKFGVALLDGERIQKVVEKPKTFVSNWAITGAYVFGPEIFQAIANIVPSWRGELEITDAIQWLIVNGKNVVPFKTDKLWLDTGSPENLLKANEYLLKEMKQMVKLGRDCVITNSQLIAPLVIGDRCTITDSVIGPAVSVGSDNKLSNIQTNNSLFMDHVILSDIKPKISNSIISSYVNISNLDNNSELKLLLGDFSKLQS